MHLFFTLFLFFNRYNDLPRIKMPLVRQVLLKLLKQRQADYEWLATTYQHPKGIPMNLVMQYVGHEKTLIFAHHESMMNMIVQLLTKEFQAREEEDFIVIKGPTPPTKRQGYVEQFQTQDACQVGVLSLTAASTGLNLYKATLVIFAELFFTPSVLLQAEARAYRMGCQSPVQIIYLCAERSVDERIWELVVEKEKMAGKLFDDKPGKFEMDQTVDLSSLGF
jgi:SNF2 family DNA or RNA helicase